MRYTVVKVVPDPVRNEPLNVGVIVQDVVSNKTRARFTPDVDRLRTYADETLDTDALSLILDRLEETLKKGDPRKSFMEDISRTFNQTLQFTEPAASLGVDLDTELDTLYDRFVSLDKRGRRAHRVVGRNTVVARVRRTFEQFKVPVVLRRMYAGIKSPYTFDFVLEAERVHAFQCFSFGMDPTATVDEAKVFVYSYRDIVAKAQQSNERRIQEMAVTAIVHPPATETEDAAATRRIIQEVAEVQSAESSVLERYVESFARTLS
jgi:hypothetical protein